MTQSQLLHEFGQLEMPQQLELLREALRLMQQAAPGNFTSADAPSKKSLSEAAALLCDDYAQDSELTSFTALDGEPVHATR